MEKAEKDKISALRSEGKSYREIAETTGIPLNTVQSYCRRNNIVCDDSKIKVICLWCAKPIIQNDRKVPQKFCCNECRYKWHHKHKKYTETNSVSRICEYCGKEFVCHAHKERKYCTSACYFEARFGNPKKEIYPDKQGTVSHGTGLSGLPIHCRCASCPWFNSGKRCCADAVGTDKAVSPNNG